MNIFALFLAGLVLLVASPAAADETTPLFYSRTNIVVMRKQMPPLPWAPAAATSSSITFDVEVRDATTLYNQKGWFSLSSPSEENGVLLAFSVPTVAAVPPSKQYAPLDILFIDKEGKILQIAPGILLSELEEEIYPATPVLAFLFLRGGACARLSIQPGDEVEHALFKKPPVILRAPEPVAPPPSQPQ